MSIIGKKMPERCIHCFQKNKFCPLAKDGLKGQWGVLFFCPEMYAPFCWDEFQDVATNYSEFQKINCAIYTMHSALCETAKSLARAFEKNCKYKKIRKRKRATFILNPEGKIAAYSVLEGSIQISAEEILARVKTLQFIAHYSQTNF